MKYANISIFVPNNGCPHMCSFCNQFKITGKTNQPTEHDIDVAFNKSNLSKKIDVRKEIAFFGGSFTAIDKRYMKSLLSGAYKYVESGDVDGIRISTRPDCINPEILKVLKSYGVTSIELGAQSMVDEVLYANNRGHNSEDVMYSSSLIKEHGFELGLQMMTGLYKSSEEDDIYTANEFIKLSPDAVRIYPTLTMRETKLQQLYNCGEYIPKTLDETVKLCSKLLCMFKFHKIKVIRIGLHSSDGIRDNFIAGPWHPAFRELCESEIIINECIDIIKELNLINKPIKISVLPNELSKIIGHKKAGIKKIKEFCPNVLVEKDSSLRNLKFKIKKI